MINELKLKINISVRDFKIGVDKYLDNLKIWYDLEEICKTDEIYGNFGEYYIEYVGNNNEIYQPYFFKKIEKCFKDLGFKVKTNFDDFIVKKNYQDYIIKIDQEKYNI
jgi:hypothetical protein